MLKTTHGGRRQLTNTEPCELELEGILLPSDRERLRSEVKAGMERELENIIQEVRVALTPMYASPLPCGLRPGGQRGPKGAQSSLREVVYLMKGGQ